MRVYYEEDYEGRAEFLGELLGKYVVIRADGDVIESTDNIIKALNLLEQHGEKRHIWINDPYDNKSGTVKTLYPLTEIRIFLDWDLTD